jgi:hypothetical protein
VRVQAAFVPGVTHQYPTLVERKRAVGEETIDAKPSLFLEAGQVDEENLGSVAFETISGKPQPIEALSHRGSMHAATDHGQPGILVDGEVAPQARPRVAGDGERQTGDFRSALVDAR